MRNHGRTGACDATSVVGSRIAHECGEGLPCRPKRRIGSEALAGQSAGELADVGGAPDHAFRHLKGAFTFDVGCGGLVEDLCNESLFDSGASEFPLDPPGAVSAGEQRANE